VVGGEGAGDAVEVRLADGLGRHAVAWWKRDGGREATGWFGLLLYIGILNFRAGLGWAVQLLQSGVEVCGPVSGHQ
jgi:hypothetical protein